MYGFKKIIAVSAATVTVMLALLTISSCTGLLGFDDTHFDYDYDEEWVLGNSLENVRKRYGEFDSEAPTRVGYFLDARPYLGVNEMRYYYYYMEYDSEGIITDVYVTYEPGG